MKKLLLLSLLVYTVNVCAMDGGSSAAAARVRSASGGKNQLATLKAALALSKSNEVQQAEDIMRANAEQAKAFAKAQAEVAQVIEKTFKRIATIKNDMETAFHAQMYADVSAYCGRLEDIFKGLAESVKGLEPEKAREYVAIAKLWGHRAQLIMNVDRRPKTFEYFSQAFPELQAQKS
jgi:hypothetical protein